MPKLKKQPKCKNCHHYIYAGKRKATESYFKQFKKIPAEYQHLIPKDLKAIIRAIERDRAAPRPVVKREVCPFCRPMYDAGMIGTHKRLKCLFKFLKSEMEKEN